MEILILFTALIFYFIGYYAGAYHDVYVDAKKVFRKRLSSKKGSLINYITPEEKEYRGSEREKIDKEQTKLIKEAGIV